MRCVIYTRVSTQEQGRDGASLSVQLQACRAFAAQQGWVMVDELQDIQSGLDTLRSAYQQVLDLARTRSIDVVLVWRLDRFGRDDSEALPRLKELARHRVRVVSATEGEQSAFLQKLMFLLANEESRRTADRVRPAMRRRAEEGLWMGKPPMGYRMDPARPGHLVIDEATAPLVRELFRQAAAGISVHEITGWLNMQTTPDGAPLRSPRGKYFIQSTIRDLLKRPVYIGMVSWNLTRQSKLDGYQVVPAEEHVIVPGQHEPLIDRALFDQVQAMLASVSWTITERIPRHFLLTGLVRCGVCGAAASGQRDANPHKRFFRYRCRQRAHAQISGLRLDALVLQQVAALPLPTDAATLVLTALAHDVAAEPDRGADLQAQRKRHEERRRRLTLFLADGTLTPDDYRTAIADIEQALATIDRELAVIAPRTDQSALVRDVGAWMALAAELGEGTLSATLPGASLTDQAAVVAAAVERVTLYKEKEPEITWRPWAAMLRGIPEGVGVGVGTP